MKVSILASALAFGLCLALVDPTAAAPLTALSSTTTGSTTSYIFGDTLGSGLFSDTLSFTAAGSKKFSSFLSNYPITIGGLTLSLYKNSVAPSNLLGTEVASSAGPLQFAVLNDTIGSGSYVLDISGNAAASGSYAGSMTLSAVPLPPALPLFGAGIFSLAVIRFSMRRRNDDRHVAV